MSRVDAMIAKHRPSGVVWKTLGEVSCIKNGKDHKLLNEGSFPVYGSGGIIRYVDTYVYNKPSVLIPRKGSLKNIFYTDVPFWNIDTIFYTEINEKHVVPKFLYHALTNIRLDETNQASGVPSQIQSILNKIKIPIPPLSIQQEIVSILDKFDTLINSASKGLLVELEARKKQYNYYRNKLLSFEDPKTQEGVVWKTLGEVFNIRNGYTPSKSIKSYWENGTIPWFTIEDIRKNGRALSSSKILISKEAIRGGSLFPANSILISTSATIGEYALIAVQHLSSQRFTSIALKPDFLNFLDMKFVFHYCSILKKLYLKSANSSHFLSVNMAEFKKIKIPIPPLEVQERIVNVLNSFTKLESELESELEARKKQYNYYRNKLLSFDILADHD